MKQTSRITAAHRLLGAVLGTSLERTRQFDRILHTLIEAGRDVIVELSWPHRGQRHLLRLKQLKGDRVYFTNPAKAPGNVPGAVLTDGLCRRVEPDGLESARLTDLRWLFETGEGEAILL